MRNLISFGILLIGFWGFAQPNTEVYLFDISYKNDKIEVKNQRNISNNDGYDNQPSFFNDNIVLFSSTRNDQTDIAAYSIRDAKIQWLSDTPNGSEYSPTKIPNKKEISAIRLDKDNTQLLYTYNYNTTDYKVLLKDLKVGYHCWYNEDIIVSAVLDDDALSLVVSNLQDKSNYTFQKKVGRSLHKIPNSKLISYISKENETWEIKSLDPLSGATKKIINTIPEAEDMCWLLNGTILMGKANKIYKYNPKTDKDWSIFCTFEDKGLSNISRIATNPTSSLLAIVSEVIK